MVSLQMFFSKTSKSEVPLLEKAALAMSDIHVSNEGVIKLMKGLNPSKALGYTYRTHTHTHILKSLL